MADRRRDRLRRACAGRGGARGACADGPCLLLEDPAAPALPPTRRRAAPARRSRCASSGYLASVPAPCHDCPVRPRRSRALGALPLAGFSPPRLAIFVYANEIADHRRAYARVLCGRHSWCSPFALHRPIGSDPHGPALGIGSAWSRCASIRHASSCGRAPNGGSAPRRERAALIVARMWPRSAARATTS